jgi:quinolinate synthase
MSVDALTAFEKTQLSERQPLPDGYLGLSDAVLDRRIAEAKRALGDRLVILGHHYQRDEVIKFADYTGDSLKLSRQAASHHEAELIVFCGVHFMAESADILSAPGQQVVLPDLAAGCSMSDMAAPDQVEQCWGEIEAMGVSGVIPVVYINSAASIKAFVGERGGLVCTSSNAAGAIRWAFDPAQGRGERVLFLPDQHLGRNTAWKMGIPLEQMVVWDPELPFGGLTAGALRAARLILWKGHCSVHTRFSVQQIDRIRAAHPDIRVIVHPECTWDVVQAADESGSTEHIIQRITDSPDGSAWAVGTEVHLVSRLARQLEARKTVLSLEPFGCLCSTMFRVSPNHLLWSLEELLEGRVPNRIAVPASQKRWALEALNRMLAVA